MIHERKPLLISGVFYILMCFIIMTTSVYAENSHIGGNRQITLYGMYPTSGDLKTTGDGSLAAFDLAVSDFNTYLKSIGSDIQIVPNVLEITSETDSAVEKVIKLGDSRATAILTYLSDDQADAIKEYCISHGILLLATGVTSPIHADPHDNLIRFNPDDTLQGKVTSQFFSDKGFTRIVPIVRDDHHGGSLMNAVSQSLGEDVSIEKEIWYSPDTTDFTPVISQLDQKIGTLLKTLKPEKIAIYAVTSRELQDIMAGADTLQYMNLTKVSWIGCDSNAVLPELTGLSKPAEYAYARNFTAIDFGSDIYAKQNPTYLTLVSRTAGKNPDGFALATYDSVWIVLKTLVMGGASDSHSTETAVLPIAEQHYGLSGLYQMNKNGDRITGTYDIMTLVKDQNGIRWEVTSYAEVGKRSIGTNSITMIPVLR